MPRIALVALLLLVAGVACFLWLAPAERSVRAPTGTRAAVEEEHERGEHELARAEPPAGTLEFAPIAAQRTVPLDERAHISGHVRPKGGAFPATAAARIEAEVYGGRENSGPRSTLHASVARDGSFELALPQGARYAMLDVQSDVLYLAEAVKVLPGERDAVLEPELRATIAGRVLAPDGSGARGVKVNCAQLLSPDEGGKEEREFAISGEVEIDLTSRKRADSSKEICRILSEADGTFEFVLMPTGVALRLEAENPSGLAWRQDVAPLAPGELRTVVIALDPGLTLAGRVIDEHGAPVAGVVVDAQEPSSADPTPPIARTDSDGRFELTGLARQSWKVEVVAFPLARSAELVVDGTTGDVRDLVLSVVRGGCIEGTVAWPDGRAAESFTLEATGHEGGWQRGEFRDGRFEQCGIGEGDHELDIHASGAGVEGKAHLSGVHAGDRDLRIVLEMQGLFEVRGTVVDSAGRPVKDFMAGVSWGMGSNSQSAEDGAFVLEGLSAGECDIVVSAEGMQRSEQRVLVGPRTPTLHFVLLQGGRIRGTVVDARGQPVANAIVGDGGRWIYRDQRLFSPKARTSDDGRFDVAATSAQVRLQAACKGFGASEPLELSVAPGEVVEGVVLRLREPCRLEGRVLDADGRPVPGATIRLRSGRAHDFTTADARGEFAFEELPPGEASVSALTSDDSRTGADVTLADGRTTRVELRFQRPDPVRIHGRIVRGGKPFVGVLSFGSNDASARVTSDADGRFETTFARPGAWKCVVWLGTNQSDVRPEDVRVLDFTVPAGESHELALDVDAMSVLSSLDELDD